MKSTDLGETLLPDGLKSSGFSSSTLVKGKIFAFLEPLSTSLLFYLVKFFI